MLDVQVIPTASAAGYKRAVHALFAGLEFESVYLLSGNLFKDLIQ
jgi:hypothetical protein